MLEAYRMYTDNFIPNFQKISNNTNSKGGIIGSILLILEFGDTLFTAIKSLFSNDQTSIKSKDTLVRLAMNLVASKITNQLTYPTWKEMGLRTFNANTEPTVALAKMSQTFTEAPISRNQTIARNPSLHSNNSLLTNSEKSGLKKLGMVYYGTEKPVKLLQVDKGIAVGSDLTAPISMNLFATAETMDIGSRFWVTLQGKQHTQFFYYDTHLGSWQDPFGKGIVVGDEADFGTTTSKTYLPSSTSFFEITDETEEEHFLILVSNDVIPLAIKNFIFAETAVGVSFLKNLEGFIPLKYPSLQAENELILPAIEAHANYYAIYITILKNKIR